MTYADVHMVPPFEGIPEAGATFRIFFNADGVLGAGQETVNWRYPFGLLTTETQRERVESDLPTLPKSTREPPSTNETNPSYRSSARN
jgi:hypothetical protein